jgi:preprotein translocase subunit Sss1
MEDNDKVVMKKFITVALICALGYAIFGPIGLALAALYYVIKW